VFFDSFILHDKAGIYEKYFIDIQYFNIMLKRYFFCLLLFPTIAFTQFVNFSSLGELPIELTEPSGMQFIYNPINGHFEYWIHNDYSMNYDPLIHSIRLDDINTITRTIDLDIPYIDFEEMAMDENENLYIGDFGNWVYPNDPIVYKFPGPNSFSGATPPNIESIKYEYPTTGVTDAETMIHLNGSLYIFSKTVDPNRDASLDPTHTYIYKIPDYPAPGGVNHIALLHDSKQVILPTDANPNRYKIVGAALSPNKKVLCLLSYERIWIFSCFEGDDFFGGTVNSFAINYRQHEAVSFLNNHQVVLTKEGCLDNIGNPNCNPNNNPNIYYLDLWPYIDGSCIDCNNVQNGNFQEGNKAWSLFKFGNADGSLSVNNGTATIDVTNIGTNNWHLNIRHKSLVLSNGKNYRIKYTAFADDPRMMSVIANKKDGSLGYAYSSHQITTTPTEYEFEFTMDEPTDYNSYLSFNVGNFVAHKVYLQDISLEEVSCTCPNSRYFLTPMDQRAEKFEAASNIYGSSIIENSDVVFDAGNQIELNSGFEVKITAVFEGYIDGCGGL